jgi:predicted nucleotidyltransferase
MKLFELAQNKTLNPKLWDGIKLKTSVQDKLSEIADEFIEFIDVPNMEIEDIVITGSNANYNWTQSSDIDLHIIVDLKQFAKVCSDFTDDFFADKKALWNERHKAKIYGHVVEVYVQDSHEKHIASGVYSILNNKWVVKPQEKKVNIDDTNIKAKVKQIIDEINDVIETKGSYDAADELWEKIRKFRRAGLSRGGEYSTENLVFKKLRQAGYLDKLSQYKRDAKTEELTLK